MYHWKEARHLVCIPHNFNTFGMSSLCLFLSDSRSFVAQCQGLEIVNPKYFFPFPWFKANAIKNQKKSLEEWEDFFKDAYSADFFASSGMGSSNTRFQRPKYYGRQKPAFLYLGPKYCPTSYFSAKLFWNSIA